MAARTSGRKSDTVATKIQQAQLAAMKVPIPEGVQLDSTEEILIYEQLAASRSIDCWRDMDLIMLAKAAHLEFKIRSANIQLNDQGLLVKKVDGQITENPLIRVIDTLQRQQLSIMRMLSLGTADGRSMNTSGKKAINQVSQRQRKSDRDQFIENMLAPV